MANISSYNPMQIPQFRQFYQANCGNCKNCTTLIP